MFKNKTGISSENLKDKQTKQNKYITKQQKKKNERKMKMTAI